MDLGLGTATALVTAGGGGIGLAIALALAAEGARVWVVDRDLPSPGDARPLSAIAVDLLQPDAARGAVEEVVASAGRIDVLVNCMGGPSGDDRGFLAQDDEAWQRTIDRNLLVAVRASRAAIPHMLAAGGGAIVNVASDLARQPDPRFVDYAAAKAALLSLSKSLSVEFGPTIRVNAVSPGPTRTPGFVQHFFDHVGPANGVNGEEAIRRYVEVERAMPSGRLGTVEEVAAAVAFVASGVASQITGTEIVVDGGVRKGS
ncbi:MAG: putative oxidoreductase [Conexibacter sp.]|nr:putative oxidoreductase [Conexibacter sp.]